MATSPIKYSDRPGLLRPPRCARCPRNDGGLTLIEVLIALAIISIAMTAIIKAVSQNIRTTSYLQTKTIAIYVGQQVLNEARVGILKIGSGSERVNAKTTMLDRDWYWQADEKSTPNQRIKKVTVRVYEHEPKEDETPVINMEGYLYHE